MKFLHKNREQFLEAINLAEYQTGIAAQTVEKDYYVTMILGLMVNRLPYIVFKGGTSLSKCHRAVKRFSEDIDIAVDITLSHGSADVKWRKSQCFQGLQGHKKIF